MKYLVERHFEATKKRGKITPKTKVSHFIDKMMEEDGEMFREMIHYINHPDRSNEMAQEVIDSIMTRINFLKHFGFDFEMELFKNTQHQETRKD